MGQCFGFRNYNDAVCRHQDLRATDWKEIELAGSDSDGTDDELTDTELRELTNTDDTDPELSNFELAGSEFGLDKPIADSALSSDKLKERICIFIAERCSIKKLEVHTWEKVRQIKDKLEITGTPIGQQFLIYAGFILDDEKQLRSYNIINNSHLSLREGIKRIHVKVRLYNGLFSKKITMHVKPDDSIEYIMRKINKAIPYETYLLEYKGEILYQRFNLSDYQIQNESTLNILNIRTLQCCEIGPRKISGITPLSYIKELDIYDERVCHIKEACMKIENFSFIHSDTSLDESKLFNDHNLSEDDLKKIEITKPNHEGISLQFTSHANLPIIVAPPKILLWDPSDPMKESINIMDVNNNTFQIFTKETMTVWKLKRILQANTSMGPGLRRIIVPNFNSHIEMLNTESVNPSRFGKTLLVLKSDEDMYLIIKVPYITDKFIPLLVQGSDKIKDIKTRICELLQFSNQYDMKFEEVLNDDRNLDSYGINKGSTLTLVPKTASSEG